MISNRDNSLHSEQTQSNGQRQGLWQRQTDTEKRTEYGFLQGQTETGEGTEKEILAKTERNGKRKELWQGQTETGQGTEKGILAKTETETETYKGIVGILLK